MRASAALPVAVVSLGIIALWYLAAIGLNWQVVADMQARAGATQPITSPESNSSVAPWRSASRCIARLVARQFMNTLPMARLRAVSSVRRISAVPMPRPR